MTTALLSRRAARRPPAPRPGWHHRVLGWLLLGLGVTALVLVVWGALAAFAAATHVRTAAVRVREARSAIADQDLAAAQAAVLAAARETRAASSDASVLPLGLAARLPGRAGALLSAVQTTVDASDQALSDGAVPLMGVVRQVGDPKVLLRADGSIDVARLASAAGRVRPAAAALAGAQRRLQAVDTGALPHRLVGPVQQARDGVGALATAAGDADAVLAALPSALGADRPRSYLVAFQNTAELRPTGGIIGTWAEVGVADGRIRLQGVGADDDLEALRGPVRDLGAEYSALYPPEQVRLSQNVNLSPHFPDAAQLLSDLWVAQGRPAPDGVVAVDASGLAPLLRGSGDIAVPGGPPVNAGTVVDVVLRQAYADFAGDNAARKHYLSAVVATAFAKALGGGAFTPAALSGLRSAVQEGHVVAWSPEGGLQAALSAVGAAGELPAPSTGTAGVYLTNTSASKLDYYLTESVAASGGCGADPAHLRIGLHNQAPAVVPDYVADKLAGVARTTESLLVAVYLPPDRGASQVRVDGAPVLVATGTERGWSMARVSVQVPRGATTTVDVDLSGAPAPLDHVLTQPLVRSANVDVARCS